MSEIMYNPMCSMCRDAAGRVRAGIKDHELCGGHLREEYDKLKAERDRLKETVKFLENSGGWVIPPDLVNLRARYAALVGEAERIIGRVEFTENYPSAKDRLESILDAAKRLKAALAEVKG